MNIITQEAKKKQAIVKYALKKGKSKASRMYGVSHSSVKRWCKQYDGTWQSLLPNSHISYTTLAFNRLSYFLLMVSSIGILILLYHIPPVTLSKI